MARLSTFCAAAIIIKRLKYLNIFVSMESDSILIKQE